jgi:bacterioferritin-associated ferredoxin
MIICSCNVLTKARIIAAAEELSRQNPGRAVTPGRILRVLGVKADCTICFKMIRVIIAEAGIMVTCPEPLATVADEDEPAPAK